MSDPDKATFKVFNESTLPDAEMVACAAFHSDGMRAYLRKILASPYARESHAESYGDIAYVDGKPVAFQAVMLHRLYKEQKPFTATIGSSLGVIPGTSPVVLLTLIERSILPRNNSQFFFGNTSVKTAAKLHHYVGVTETGGDSWNGYRYSVVHPFRFLRYLFETKFLKRSVAHVTERMLDGKRHEFSCNGFKVVRQNLIDKELFNGFWQRYLERNRGVVSSRTAEELEWMFGDNIRNGLDILLAAFRDGLMKGYIVVRSAEDGRWKVMDMIAVGNDPAVLSGLLSGAKKFLRRYTRAAMLRISGFPEFAQPLISRHFPHRRQGGNIPFIYQPYDIPKETSWFFGPYDGDAAF